MHLMLRKGHSLRAVASAFALGLLPGAALAAAPPPAGPPARKVVVLPLGSLGVDEDVAASLLGFLRAEVSKLPGITVVDLTKSHKLVGAECKGEERCLAAAGGKLGAETVVTGTVAGMGEAYSIDLKGILVRTGREDARITEVISGERELLIDGIRGAAYKLLLPSQYVGTIQVELPEEGAEVFVDGRPAGKSPLKAPIPNLTPGKHALKIVKPGFADFDKWIDVRFARVSVVKVDLKNSSIAGVMFEKEQEKAPAPAAAVEPAAPVATQVGFFTVTGQRVGALVVAGVGLVAVGGGFYFAKEAKTAQRRVEGLAAKVPEGGGVLQQDAPEARGYLEAMRANAVAADSLWIAGGLAVAGGVVLWLTGGGTATPVVSVGPGGASIGLAGSF